jgi:hypothetical protein
VGPFSHVDAYGVLHHLPDPAHTLKLISDSMLPNATMRIMVYNSKARDWIFQIQRIFKLLKINLYKKEDRIFCKNFLLHLKDASEFLREKLQNMVESIIENDSRLVDTFLHEREARISIRRWFEMFSKVGLKPFAMFDRYEELDDLNNPLWELPSIEDLEKRIESGFYEGNFEIYLYKPRVKESKYKKIQIEEKKYSKSFLHNPPTKWMQTKKIHPKTLNKIWRNYIDAVSKSEYQSISELQNSVPFVALQRLVRLGAIWPRQIDDMNFYQTLVQPISLEAPQLPSKEFSTRKREELISLLKARLKAANIFSDKRFDLIVRRLDRL